MKERKVFRLVCESRKNRLDKWLVQLLRVRIPVLEQNFKCTVRFFETGGFVFQIGKFVHERCSLIATALCWFTAALHI
jgi:hypothetical protein